MTRVLQSEIRMPSWKWRLAVSMLTIVVAWMLIFAYGTVQGPLEAHAAVQQLEDSASAYAASRTWAASDIAGAIKWIACVALGFVWVPFFAGAARYAAAQEK